MKSYFYWLGGALLAFSVLVRLVSYHVVTSDYTYFLSKWFVTLAQTHGLSAFHTPFADYAPLYLYLLKLLTFLPVPSLYSIKSLSVLFDLAIAVLAYVIIQKTLPGRYTKAELFFVSALFFAIPTVVINSALWAQSDSLYAFGVLLSLYFILTNKPLPAALAFAFAFCLKFQAIFFVPILVGYLLRKEKTAGYLLLILGVFFLSIIPARLAGGSLGDLLLVYAKQSGEYTSLSISAQNIFALLGSYHPSPFVEQILFWAGLGLAGLCAVCVAAAMYYFKRLSPRATVALSLLCVLAVPYLLPRMHERYFYLADIFSVLYLFYTIKTEHKAWFVPGLVSVLAVGASLAAYMPYLNQVSWFANVHVNLLYPSLAVLLALVLLLRECYKVVATAERVVS